MIASGLLDLEFTKVMSIKTTKETWDKFISIHERDEKVKKAKLQIFRRQFEGLKLDEEDIVPYFHWVDEVSNSLKGIVEKFKEKIVV